MNWLWVKHKLTAYHWRYDRGDGPAALAICECGWKCRLFRKSPRDHLRRVHCLLRGHDWGESEPVLVGPAGAPDEEMTLIAMQRQCDRCWKCESERPS